MVNARSRGAPFRHRTLIEVAKTTLWTLVIGGSATIGKSERAWYVVHLAGLCEQLDLYCWSGVENILVGIV